MSCSPTNDRDHRLLKVGPRRIESCLVALGRRQIEELSLAERHMRRQCARPRHPRRRRPMTRSSRVLIVLAAYAQRRTSSDKNTRAPQRSDSGGMKIADLHRHTHCSWSPPMRVLGSFYFHVLFLAAALLAAACGDDEVSGTGDASTNNPETTPCPPTGDLICETGTHVCVKEGAFGPSYTSSCKPVPSGCETDRMCDCLSPSLCPPGTFICTELAANTIFCDNGTQ
jgi:hypothetical protein